MNATRIRPARGSTANGDTITASLTTTARVSVALVLLAASLLGAATDAVATPGDTQWTRRHNGPASDYDKALSMAVSPDGTAVYVTGYDIPTSGGTDYLTVAYNASSGAILWTRRYNGPANSGEIAHSVAVNPDGTAVYVTGESLSSTNGNDYVTIAYGASSGTPLWTKRYNGPQNADDNADSVTVSPDGTEVYVTGFSTGLASNGSVSRDYLTIAYNASSGATLWRRRYNGPANADDEAHSVAVNPNGAAVYVTGHSHNIGGVDYYTIAYSASSGATIWARRYDGPSPGNFRPDVAHSVTVSPDGTAVYVTGQSVHLTANDYATIAYGASSGTPLWAKRYNGAANGDDLAYSVAVSPDGTAVYVTGESLSSTSGKDYATIAYGASSGTSLWTRRYDGPGNGDDLAYSVAVSPDGTAVYVTGESLSSTADDNDYATIAYSASTAVTRWVRRYDGPANLGDVAQSVAVNPNGAAVYVTGQSVSSTGGGDYATIAYSTT